MIRHVVRQGEHLPGIARAYGFVDEEAVWTLDDNRGLRDAGRTPVTLLAGDVVVLPERQRREYRGATNKRHRLEVLQRSLKLRLRLHTLADEPLAGTACIVRFGSVELKLTTDGSGGIEFLVPDYVQAAELEVGETPNTLASVKVPFFIGHLDPVTELSGQLARLSNLGYRAGMEANGVTRSFRSAVEEFQCDHALPVDGVCGSKTQDKLRRIHGC